MSRKVNTNQQLLPISRPIQHLRRVAVCTSERCTPPGPGDWTATVLAAGPRSIEMAYPPRDDKVGDVVMSEASRILAVLVNRTVEDG
jgi:hypothetical protein